MYSVNVIYLLSNDKMLIETVLCPHMFWFSYVLVFGMEYTYYRWILIISASVGDGVKSTKVGGRIRIMGEYKISKSYETFTV